MGLPFVISTYSESDPSWYRIERKAKREIISSYFIWLPHYQQLYYHIPKPKTSSGRIFKKPWYILFVLFGLFVICGHISLMSISCLPPFFKFHLFSWTSSFDVPPCLLCSFLNLHYASFPLPGAVLGLYKKLNAAAWMSNVWDECICKWMSEWLTEWIPLKLNWTCREVMSEGTA